MDVKKLKVAELAAGSKDYKRAVEIYEQVRRTIPPTSRGGAHDGALMRRRWRFDEPRRTP